MVTGRIETIITQALLDELLDVIGRPRLGRYEIDDDVVGAILELAWPGLPGIGIDVVLRDGDDRIVVEAAVAGAADAIITGDKDLLEDNVLVAWLTERGIAVLTPADLLALLDRDPA
jgi:putative PIN family toxin of toxin-antitoxin system